MPLVVVEASATPRTIFEAEAMYFDCVSDDDDIHDAAAELKQWIRDLRDLAGDLDPIREREYIKSTYEVVERLRSLGCKGSVGVCWHALRMGEGKPMPWRTLFVIVAPETKAKKSAMVERNMPVRFD